MFVYKTPSIYKKKQAKIQSKKNLPHYSTQEVNDFDEVVDDVDVEVDVEVDEDSDDNFIEVVKKSSKK